MYVFFLSENNVHLTDIRFFFKSETDIIDYTS